VCLPRPYTTIISTAIEKSRIVTQRYTLVAKNIGFANVLLLCIPRWQELLDASQARKGRLLQSQEQYKKVEDLFLLFAKKASAFNSWFENAEEDLTDPVRCNSVEEIRV
jgi:hypothetical protein